MIEAGRQADQCDTTSGKKNPTLATIVNQENYKAALLEPYLQV